MSEEKKKTPTEENKEAAAEDTAVEVQEEEEKPKPKEYTPEEIEEIAKKVETPSDNTPPYNPENILSPEFNGTSNYEIGVTVLKEETEQRLASLKSNPDASTQQIIQAEEDLKTIAHLYENYNLGMNVFRTAKGGRDKLRE